MRSRPANGTGKARGYLEVRDLKKRLTAAVLVLSAVGLFAAMAGTASATPGKTTRCTGCHSGPSVAVSATLASTTGTTATYNVSAPSADAIAIFDGTTKLGSTVQSSSGQFTVAFGKTYTIYAIQGPNDNDGIGSTTVSPVAPAPTDTTAPSTTSNAVATYVTSANVMLTALDEFGGSGVAHTYYVLDGAAPVEGTMVSTSVLGAHTLEYWSVDVATNVETHKFANFAVNAPAPDPDPVPDTTAPSTFSNVVGSYFGTATVTLTAVDEPGGSGVAGTYYELDGAGQLEGTTVTTSVLGVHTLSFWSVDASGNVEVTNQTSFEVKAALAGPAKCTVGARTSAIQRRHRIKLTGMVTPAQAGDRVLLYVKRPGSSHYVRLATLTALADNGAGTATWSRWSTLSKHGTYRFQVRFGGVVSNTFKVYVR